MAKILLFTAMILIVVHGFSQVNEPAKKQVENAYEKFKKEFHNEFGEDTGNNDVAVLNYRPPVQVADWFFGFTAGDASSQVCIGISDPGLDSLDALQQATIRGLALAGFSRQAQIQNVSDNYYLDDAGEKTLGKFNSFTSFLAEDSLGYTILEKQYTTNGEMLVLMKIDPAASDIYYVRSNLELFQSETSGRLINRLLFDINATDGSGNKIKTSWLLKENDKSYEINSDWNGQQLNILKAKFKYLSPVTSAGETAAPDDFKFDMKYGLWYAYLNAMAANMEQMDTFSSQVKYLDDTYDERFQDLTRVVFTENISFGIAGINITDNQLSLSLVKY